MPHAVLANTILTKQGGCNADKSKVVERHHNGAVRCACTNHGRRERWEEIMNVDDVRLLGIDSSRYLSNGPPRPDGFDRTSSGSAPGLVGGCPQSGLVAVLGKETEFILDDSVLAARASAAVPGMEDENTHDSNAFVRGKYFCEEVDVPAGHTTWTSILADPPRFGSE